MGPRNKKVEVDSSPFLFVNQDATTPSLFKKDPKLNRSKQSHVQRQHFAKKRQALLLEQKVKPTHQNPIGDEATVPEGRPGLGRAVSSSKPKILPRDSSSNESNAQNVKGNRHVVLDSEEPQRRVNSRSDHVQQTLSRRSSSESSEDSVLGGIPRSLVQSLEVMWDGGHISDTLGINIGAWGTTLMQYYKAVVAPSIFRTDSRALKINRQTRHFEAVNADVQECFTSRTHFFAFLASQTARMTAVEGAVTLPGISHDQLERGPFILRTQTLHELRSQLEAGYVDEGMVTDVNRLYATEFLLDDPQTAGVHFRALEYMIQSMGGLHCLNQYLREKIITGVIFAAAKSLSPPKLELTWDPGDLPEDLRSRVKPPPGSPLRNLGKWFFHPAHAALFHTDMQAIFRDLVSEVLLNVYSWSHASLNDDHLTYMLLRRTALEHRLLSFPEPEDLSQPDAFIQEAVRIALSFWVGLCFADPIREKIVPPLTVHLRTALENSGLQILWYPNSDLLLWVCVTGAIASQGTMEYEWFASKAAKIASYLNITEVDSLAAFLGNFFYLEEIHGEALENLQAQFDFLLHSSESVIQVYSLPPPESPR